VFFQIGYQKKRLSTSFILTGRFWGKNERFLIKIDLKNDQNAQKFAKNGLD
jgi:hypothetical protein